MKIILLKAIRLTKKKGKFGNFLALFVFREDKWIRRGEYQDFHLFSWPSKENLGEEGNNLIISGSRGNLDDPFFT